MILHCGRIIPACDVQRVTVEPMANQPEYGGHFSTTHWSLVVQAGDVADPGCSIGSGNALCSRYWFPLYAFVRREGCGIHDARI